MAKSKQVLENENKLLLAELKQALKILQEVQRETKFVTTVTQNHWDKLIKQIESDKKP